VFCCFFPFPLGKLLSQPGELEEGKKKGKRARPCPAASDSSLWLFPEVWAQLWPVEPSASPNKGRNSHGFSMASGEVLGCPIHSDPESPAAQTSVEWKHSTARDPKRPECQGWTWEIDSCSAGTRDKQAARISYFSQTSSNRKGVLASQEASTEYSFPSLLTFHPFDFFPWIFLFCFAIVGTKPKASHYTYTVFNHWATPQPFFILF